MNFTIKNNHIKELLNQLDERAPIILKAVGIEAQGNAIDEITRLRAVDTGRLRNSMDYKVNDKTVYIGTNVEYAPYVELGTHKMAARPFLRNAILNYADDYKHIVKEGLK
jgi:HK97 gp10 family phage protein